MYFSLIILSFDFLPKGKEYPARKVPVYVYYVYMHIRTCARVSSAATGIADIRAVTRVTQPHTRPDVHAGDLQLITDFILRRHDRSAVSGKRRDEESRSENVAPVRANFEPIRDTGSRARSAAIEFRRRKTRNFSAR